MKRKKQKTKYKIIMPIILVLVLLISILIIENKKQEEIIEIPMAGQYIIANFDTTKEYYTYDDDTYTSMVGIDVSEHNGTIDFKKVKESGIEFVFIRIGWRGYTKGGIYKDEMFETYYKDAKENNLKIGIYFFSQAVSTDEAKQEAQFVLDTLGDKTINLPIVYDYETVEDENGRANNLTLFEVSNNAKAFFSLLENKYQVMLYANTPLLKLYSQELLDKYPLWYAQFHHTPETDTNFNIWQYSENGEVEGIEKPTDLNIMMINR